MLHTLAPVAKQLHGGARADAVASEHMVATAQTEERLPGQPGQQGWNIVNHCDTCLRVLQRPCMIDQTGTFDPLYAHRWPPTSPLCNQPNQPKARYDWSGSVAERVFLGKQPTRKREMARGLTSSAAEDLGELVALPALVGLRCAFLAVWC